MTGLRTIERARAAYTAPLQPRSSRALQLTLVLLALGLGVALGAIGTSVLTASEPPAAEQ